MLYDLLLRLQQNDLSNCASVVGNPAVVRQAPDNPQTFLDAGICPFGLAERVEDKYANLAARTVEGWDAGIYLIGNQCGHLMAWSFKHQISFLTDKSRLWS